MRRWLKIFLGLFLGLALLLALGGWWTHRAWHHVPDFYRQAVEGDSSRQSEAGDKMEQRVTALAGDLKKEGPWHAVFTADQINGWLAHKLAKEFPHLRLGAIRDPRVSIRPQELLLACRFDDGTTNCVLSLNTDAYLAQPNVLALRIRGVHAGRIPVPSERVCHQISAALQRLELTTDWRQADDDPVLLITLPELRDAKDKVVRVETVRLGDGEIYLGGSTGRRR